MPRVFYQEKLGLFQKLAQISGQMATYTTERFVQEEGAIESFQSLLQERETIIDQVDRLDRKISKLQVDSLENQEAIRKIQALATEIKHYNETTEAVAKTALNQLRDQTKKVQEGRQSSKAYDSRVHMSEGAFIDKRR